jgi:hypothetical protein
MRVYHFVDSIHGINNLALRRLKVSRINDLNDPFEFLAADLLDIRNREALHKFKNQLDASVGMVCFSRAWSNPLLWGHYANNHRGIALGFDVPDDSLFPVIYTNQRAKIKFDENSRTVVGGKSVANKLLCTKFSDWKYEEESRFFVSLDILQKEGRLYFLEFSSQLLLKEVIVGLNCEVPLLGIRNLLQEDLNLIRVKKAGLALRVFKVIEDRTPRSLD